MAIIVYNTFDLLSMRILIFLLINCYTFNIFAQDTASNDDIRKAKIKSILSSIQEPKISENTIHLTKFGGKGDGKHDNKRAFDKAMGWVKKKNGGKIIVPPGDYLINGPIHFVSNTTLEIEKGAKIIFSTDEKHYLPTVLTSWEGTFIYNYSPLIYAYRVENVAITGEGIIDGMGKEGFSQWYDLQKPAQALSRKWNHEATPVNERKFEYKSYLRPHLIQFLDSKNILLEGVTIQNSPFWCVHFLRSENITCRRVKFDAMNKNNDGFDIEYAKNVLIEDVDFGNADDNITIKAGRDREGRETGIITENIVVRNCRFKGLHGLVIGSEMSAGVQHVYVENCTSSGYCKRGIYLKSNADRGGFMRNIYLNNVQFGDVEDAVYITAFYKGEGHGHETEIHRVFIENLSVKTANNYGIVIQGYPTKKVNNIIFNNVKINRVKNAMSLTNTENIIFNDVILGEEATIPTSVQ